MAKLYKLESGRYIFYALANSPTLALTKTIKEKADQGTIIFPGAEVSITFICDEKDILRD